MTYDSLGRKAEKKRQKRTLQLMNAVFEVYGRDEFSSGDVANVIGYSLTATRQHLDRAVGYGWLNRRVYRIVRDGVLEYRYWFVIEEGKDA